MKKGRGGVGAVCIGRIPLMLRCDRWGSIACVGLCAWGAGMHMQSNRYLGIVSQLIWCWGPVRASVTTGHEFGTSLGHSISWAN